MAEVESAHAQQVELLQRIAAQDREALAEFYDQTAGVIYSTVLRMLSDASEAEEVVQDVYVQVWTKAGSYDAKLGKPFHWALGIARNRAIDRLRARQRRNKVFQESTEEQATNAITPEMDSPALLGADETAKVQSAVKNLPPDQRQAIEMAFFGGLTHAEIAGELGEPLGTVKARIRRGMLKLREDLRAYL
jgi:RNA polymerase sigma-70 factor (ECF subfamily)